MINSRVSSLRLNLQGILNSIEEDQDHLSMKQITSIPHSQVEISRVFHCDGLLLCVAKDQLRLFVWNPYLGQTRWIQTRNKPHICDKYLLGYDKNRNHKILYKTKSGASKILMDVYDFSTFLWRYLDVVPSWDLQSYYNGVSLKGNTYCLGQDVTTTGVCFDFTRESFEPRMPLPFNPPYPSFDTVALFCVRDEKLAVLYNHCDTPEIIEIWISTKVEPNAVSWSSFLTLDLSLINGLPDNFSIYFAPTSFFIDEEKKVAVLFDLDIYDKDRYLRYQMAYIVGEDGYFKSVNLGIVSNPSVGRGELVCSSYVPSLVHVQV